MPNHFNIAVAAILFTTLVPAIGITIKKKEKTTVQEKNASYSQTFWMRGNRQEGFINEKRVFIPAPCCQLPMVSPLLAGLDRQARRGQWICYL
ncbi:hypothetical protein [Kerstersia gyiorum]|uniref:hypothetical protein n=1 Tax=Kerstersia gyiorum TaxID=206506 RepID=UPI003B43C8C6